MDAQDQDTALYMIGASINGRDPLHMLSVVMIARSPGWPFSTILSTNVISPPNTTAPIDKNMHKLTNLTMSDIITIETKGSNHKPNEWLDWLVFTAQSRKLANCFICAAAKPCLATAPLANHTLIAFSPRWIKPDLICPAMRCWKYTHGLINQCLRVLNCIPGTTRALKAVVPSLWEGFHSAGAMPWWWWTHRSS